MTISAVERRKMLAAPSIGPKTIDWLDAIGIRALSDLRDADARELALRINAHLGRPHVNGNGIRALDNLIALARGGDQGAGEPQPGARAGM